MTNATAFWGTATNCPGSSTQGSTDATTCNGNGDGAIFYTGSSITSYTINETFRFWQHLANAGLIEGQYNGVTADGGNYFAGVGPSNSPKSKLSNGYWSAGYSNNATGGNNGGLFFYNFGNVFIFGGLAGTSWNSTQILKAEEAWNIDTKLDDGKPGTGFVTSSLGGNCNSATGGTDYAATYSLDKSALGCLLVFKMQ